MIKVPKFKKASKAAEWIASKINKNTWFKGDFAATAEDTELGTNVTHPQAAKFCAIGWIKKADQGFEGDLTASLCNVIGHENVDDYLIYEWNDSDVKSYTQVRSAFKKAAKLLAKQEAEEALAAKKAKERLSWASSR
jgi:hypothetical protein